MPSVRVNVSIPESTYSELKEEVPPRKRSKFITSAIKKMIDEMRRDRLAREYREASKKIRRVNKDLEGTLNNDGL